MSSLTALVYKVYEFNTGMWVDSICATHLTWLVTIGTG